MHGPQYSQSRGDTGILPEVVCRIPTTESSNLVHLGKAFVRGAELCHNNPDGVDQENLSAKSGDFSQIEQRQNAFPIADYMRVSRG